MKKKLIDEPYNEMEDIARRIIILQLEYPDMDMRGIFYNIKCLCNKYILELGEWAGEYGKLWTR